MKNLLQSFADTYFIVANTISYLMERGNIIELKYIVSDLHNAIQEIYFQGGIAFLNSCLIETIQNAFSRFAQLEVCELKSYESSEGPDIVYLMCRPTRKVVLDRYYAVLEAMSSSSNNPEKTRIIEIEIEQAVKLTTG